MTNPPNPNRLNDYESQWLQVFNELCYDVFFLYPKGAQLLAHLENRYFRSPVAIPGQDIGWAYLHEGRNELIRSFTAGMQTFMVQSDVKRKQQAEKPIPRRARVKPIHAER